MPTKQPPRMPRTKDVTVYKGTSLIMEIEVAGVGNIAAAIIAMKVKKVETDADADAIISKRTGGFGIVVTDPGSDTAPGVFQVKIDPGDTSAQVVQSYVYDIKMQLGSDVFVVIERSHFDIEPAVTFTV